MKRRILSMVICLAMVLTMVPSPSFSVSAVTSTASTGEFAGGSGTAADPYLIETKGHLNNVRNHLDAHYKMIADIAFTDADFAEGGAFYNNGNGWEPIGNKDSAFSGIFDGNGYTINGLVINIDSDDMIYAGLFGFGKHCTICNLELQNVNFKVESQSTCYVGGIVGYLQSNDSPNLVSNCQTSGSIVVASKSEMEECAAYSAGVVGYLRHPLADEITCIEKCRNYCTITACSKTGDAVAGGIVAFAYGSTNNANLIKITNVVNYGNIESSASAPSSWAYAGGIVGCNSDADVDHSENFGMITAQGGLDAYCYAVAGGICGDSTDASLTNSKNYSNVFSNAKYCYSGGICGICGGYYSNNYVFNSANFAIISTQKTTNGESFTGGIAGKNTGVISACFNEAEIKAIAEDEDAEIYIGGIIGSNDNILIDCYNAGQINSSNSIKYGSIKAGGLCGKNSGSINYGYNVGKLKASATYTYCGGIAGLNNGTIAYAYYLNDIAQGVGYGTDSAIVSSSEKLSQESTFSQFDFEGTWGFIEGNAFAYPTLQGVEHFVVNESLDFNGGDGTEQNPYLIASAKQLDNVRNDLSAHYKLVRDIEFTNADFVVGGTFYNGGQGWIPLGNIDNWLSVSTSDGLTGSFDGNGYSIKGLSMSISSEASVAYHGLFACNNGTIKNVILENASFLCSSTKHIYVGGITGINNTGIIENAGVVNCEISSVSTGASSTAAGISAFTRAESQIQNCYNASYVYAEAAGYAFAGGIVGSGGGTMIDCYSNGHIEAYYTGTSFASPSAGGLIGEAQATTIRRCYSVSTVFANKRGSSLADVYAGCISGEIYQNPSFEYCYYISGDKTGIGSSTDPTGVRRCTIEELKNTSTFVGFNFNGIWTMAGNSDYPYPELKTIEFAYNKELQDVMVYKTPNKTTYLEGKDVLDVTGGKILLIYNCGVREITDMTIEMISGYDNTKVGQQNLTVSYSDHATNFEIEIIEKSLVNISITSLPAKLTYLEGDEFDSTGLIVKANYNNGTFEYITDYTISGYSSVPGKKTIEIGYGGETTSFEVVVNAKSLTGIVVSNLPNKVVYLEGENLSTTGLEVTASYNNNTTASVTNFEISGYDSNKVGLQTITVTYGGKTATFTVTVNAKVLTGISITRRPNKLSYIQGEKIDIAGLVVNAAYNNGTNANVTGYDISGFDTNKVGQQTITVTYNGKTATFTVTVVALVPNTITSNKYIVANGFLRKVSTGTSVTELTASINEKQYVKVFRGDQEVSGDTIVGTGMVVKIMDGNTVKASAIVVVTGDTNGDGKSTVTDMLAIKSHLLKKSNLVGAAAQAADTNKDGTISITDFIQVKASILGKGSIVPN